MARPLTTSAAAWRHLTTTAGFDPEGYDRPLADFLRSPDGLDLGLSSDIGHELGSRAVPIETFLEAFFRGMRPYGHMLQDLLNLFVEAGAQHSDHGLAVEFDFGREANLGFDLEQFRQWLAQWAKSHGEVEEARWTTNQLWGLLEILGRCDEGSMPADLRRWSREYREEGRWPVTRVALSATGDPDLDRLLQRGWRLWESVVGECARLAPDRRTLNQLWHQSWKQERGQARADEETAWPLQVLGGLDSDLGPASLASGLVATAHEARTGLGGSAIAEKKARLQELFDSLPVTAVNRETWVLEWQAYLDLPLWKQRHELYSAWVSTQILAATEPLPRRVHSEAGVLRFAFGGSHVATMPTLEPAVHLWAELRSPIEHRPLGLDRKTKIQPDFTLLCDPVTGKRSAFLVVECKQYRHASKKNFLQALIDYARGRPEALIVLVNYGPIPEHWLGEAPIDLQDRLRMIGDFRPGEKTGANRFREAVRTALAPRVLGPGRQVPSTSVKTADEPRPDPPLRRIILRWQGARDLDLHLFLRSEHRSAHVYYSQVGSQSWEPWAALDRDGRQTPGREEIVLTRFCPGIYQVFVHAFSGGGIEWSDAEVELEYRGSRVLTTVPEGVSGTWWHVCDWDAGRESLSVVGRVGDEAPQSLDGWPSNA
ncbi:MAG: hypothetical protein SF066_11035 [Thermoanaerobaculia bacterium]|nr:hypothetical protein [Thermoanaerobaculia bacterium]